MQHIPSHQNQISQEFRLSSSGSSIDYVSGLYFYRQRIIGHPISIYGPLATYWLLPAGRPANLLNGYQTYGTTDFSSNSYAAFGELTWHASPRVDVTGGARYTYEAKNGSYNVQAFGGLATGLTASLINDRNSILRTQVYTGHIGEPECLGPRQHRLPFHRRRDGLCQPGARREIGRHQHVGPPGLPRGCRRTRLG